MANNTYEIWKSVTHSSLTNLFKILKAVTTEDYHNAYEQVKFIISNSNEELTHNIYELFKGCTNSTGNNLYEVLQDIYDESTESFKIKIDTSQPFLNFSETVGNALITTTSNEVDKVNVTEDDSGAYLRLGIGTPDFGDHTACQIVISNTLQALFTRTDTQFIDISGNDNNVNIVKSNGLEFKKVLQQGVITDIEVMGQTHISLKAGVMFKNFVGLHGGNTLFATTTPSITPTQKGFALITNNDTEPSLLLSIQIFNGAGLGNFDELTFNYELKPFVYYDFDFEWDGTNDSKPLMKITEGGVTTDVYTDAFPTHSWVGPSTGPLYFGLFTEDINPANQYNFEGTATYISIGINNEPDDYIPFSIGAGGVVYSTRGHHTYHIQKFVPEMWIRQPFLNNNINKGFSKRGQGVFTKASNSFIKLGDVEIPNPRDFQLQLFSQLNLASTDQMIFDMNDEINNSITFKVKVDGSIEAIVTIAGTAWTVIAPPGSYSYGDVNALNLLTHSNTLFIVNSVNGGPLVVTSTPYNVTTDSILFTENFIGASDNVGTLSCEGYLYSLKFRRYSDQYLYNQLVIINIPIILTKGGVDIIMDDFSLIEDKSIAVYYIPASSKPGSFIPIDVQDKNLANTIVVNGHNNAESGMEQENLDSALIAADTNHLWYDASGNRKIAYFEDFEWNFEDADYAFCNVKNSDNNKGKFIMTDGTTVEERNAIITCYGEELVTDESGITLTEDDGEWIFEGK